MGTNPTASHASAQGCAAMHVCLQYMCAAMQMCPHSLQSMCQHWSAVALLPTCGMRVRPGRRGTGEPAPVRLRLEMCPLPREAWLAGCVLPWPVRCNRVRSLGTNADCRTNSAQVDRQVWASGGRGRGRFTVRRGWTWASRRARAWEMGRAMRREDMLGKCCLGVRNVSWLLAGLGKEVASAEHAGPEGSGGGLCAGV